MLNEWQARRKQKGAALIIVLMLVATLSFVVLSLSRQMALSSQRGVYAASRHELHWRAIGAEALAASVLASLYDEETVRLTSESPLFSTSHELPMEDGTAYIRFADHTACFNVNSLAASSDDRRSGDEGSREEFLALVQSLNIGAGDAHKMLAALIDWMDADNASEAGGAEDRLYTSLPVPYRTGGQQLAELSEMRAMNGVRRDLFRILQPYLCAPPKAEPSSINVNLLSPAQAPILVGLAKGEISRAESISIIEARPPDGFSTIESFQELLEARVDVNLLNDNDRLALTSRYIQVNSTLELASSSLNARMIFEIDDGGDARLISRTFGPEQ